MNKGQGISGGIVAMLLAGLLVKSPVKDNPQTDTPKSERRVAVPKAATPAKSEGPWLASCAYWSPSRPSTDLAAGDMETPCGTGDKAWGIPEHHSHPLEISAIIATVPDPIHSHLALDFDRTVDTLLLAASDNRYLGSYYWLPWHNNASSLSKSDSTSSDSSGEHNDEREKIREQQPGLIILRYAPDIAKWKEGETNDALSSAVFHRVIYLFLVSETPALGVNGVQLQNAFRYEQMLLDHGASLTVRPSPAETKPPADKLSVIGPLYSGSAASLHEGIESARLNPRPVITEIAGVTGTPIAARELDPDNRGIYHSFGENAGYEQDRFLDSLTASGYDLNRVAVLTEANTLFGNVTSTAQENKGKSQTKEKPGQGHILSLRFPRELSLLRNAQATQTAKPESGAPTPYLNLSLKDYASDDTEPRFSATQSPLSIEAQLMAIAHQLERSRVQFIIISASNILDDIFLAQFLHRACPNARIVTISGGDLLFERDTDNAPYIGSISISPYLLTSISPNKPAQWLYSDGQAEAIYNAASFVFWDHNTSHLPLAGYLHYQGMPPTTEHNSRAISTRQDHTQFLRMPLWAAAIGSDGYYPLAILNWCASDTKSILPAIQQYPPDGPTDDEFCFKNNTETSISQLISQPSLERPPDSIERSSGITPSLAWSIIAATIIMVCKGHSMMLLSAQYWSPFTRDLAIDENDQPRRRTVYLSIGTAVLASMAYVTAFPLLRVHSFYYTTFVSRALAWGLLVCSLLAVLSTLLKTSNYLRHPGCREFGFFNSVALFALVFIIIAWTCICCSDVSFNHGHDTATATTGIHTFAGLYFSYRCLQPLSGRLPFGPCPSFTARMVPMGDLPDLPPSLL